MRLLERDDARADLAAALAALRRGSGSVVLVSGEAGIGKTSLLRALVADASGRARVLSGGCDDLVVPRPLGPLREIAESVSGLAHRLTTDDAARATLAELAREPTLYVVEDVHWADQATLDVLSYVVRRVEQTPVALVLSFRDDELVADHPLRRTLAAVPPGVVRRIALRPLTVDAVRRLAGPRADAEEVHAVTRGNPFFVTEVLGTGIGEISASVRDAVLGRLARLTPAARATAELVSVLPGRAELWVVDACLGDEAEIVECEQRGLLLTDGGAVRYRHELARRAVEEGLTGHRARDLHRTVLVELAARRVSDARLAHHAWQAGDADAVVRHGLAAGRLAADARSHREATELLARVVEHEERLAPRERADTYDLLSTEAYAGGQRDRALPARERALELRRELGDPVRLADTLRWLSRVRWVSGDGDGARAAADEAVAMLAETAPSREQAMALSNLSQLAMLNQSHDEAQVLGRRAMQVALAVGDVETLVHAQVNVASSHAYQDIDGGVHDLRAAAELATEHRLDDSACRALVNAAWACMEFGRWTEARDLVDDALAVARDRDFLVYAYYCHAMRALMALAAGDYDQVLVEVKQSTDRQVPSLQAAALVSLRRGEPRADALLDEGWRIATSFNELSRLRPMACARAEAAWLRDDLAALDEVTAATYALALERGHERDVGELALWRARAGLLDRVPDRCPVPYTLEIAGEHAAAARVWRDRGQPYEQALALLGSDDADDVRTALAILDSLGATAVLPRAQARLRELGVARVPRGRRSSTRHNPGGLTDRQLEVLDLMAGGLTNAEIARRLVLSAKTVEHHAGAVLAKLGLASRADTAAAAARFRRGEGGDAPSPPVTRR